MKEERGIQIGIIGNVDYGATELANLVAEKKALLVDISKQDHITDYVIVNGQTYIDKIKQVEDAVREGIGKSRLGAFAAMASVMMPSTTMFDSTDFGVKERKLDQSINIVKEYELIERKACKLSKWERDKVVQLFNKRYEKVDLTDN